MSLSKNQQRLRLFAISMCSIIFLSAPSCGGSGPGGPSGPSGPSGPTGPTTGPGGPTGPGPTGPTSTGSTGTGPGGPTGGAPGGTGMGFPPLITPQTDTGDLMLPAAPISTAMPTTGSPTRPFYQTSGTAVDIRFRRQVDVTNLKLNIDVGYLGETTAP